MKEPRRHRSWLVVAVLVLALTAAACSGDDDTKDKAGTSGAPASTGSSGAGPTAVTTSIAIAKLTGRLATDDRATLSATIQKLIDGWWDAAYLGGTYPRTDFSDAWPGFTRAARAQAQHDAALTSNRTIGAAIDGVKPERKDIRLDVLAMRKHAVGVTARIALRFATTGDQPGRVSIVGRVYLAPTGHGWRIFGYDLKGSR